LTYFTALIGVLVGWLSKYSFGGRQGTLLYGNQ